MDDETLRRLKEAEDTIKAIRTGSIDALVVRRSAEEEIFTLESGDGSYRIFMEHMNEGAAALDAEGKAIYANGPFLKLVEVGMDRLQGRKLTEFFDDSEWRRVENAMIKGDEIQRAKFEITLPDALKKRTVLLSLARLPMGMTEGWAVTASDVSEKRQLEQQLETERTASSIIESANEAVIVCDNGGTITHCSTAVADLVDGTVKGRHFAEVFHLTPSGSNPSLEGVAKTAQSLLAAALDGQEIRGIEARVENAPVTSEVLISAAPVRVIGQQIRGCVITMTDLTARKAAEAQRELLMAELDHRVKNTLAIVEAILSQTIRRHSSIDDFREAFSSRIHALSTAHKVLVRHQWKGASLNSLIRSVLALFEDGWSPKRLDIGGPDVMLAPQAALYVAMCFHELATNAVKYGSLSVPEGRVECRWAPALADRQEVIRISWRESGGPPVRPPAEMGFGGQVIERGVAYQLGGVARLEFPVEGLYCEIDLPLSQTVHDRVDGN